MPTATNPPSLPLDIHLLERGWLSSNNILLQGADRTTLIDTGYGSHAEQTLALVNQELGKGPLSQIVNTHGHSDHIGGNALLQEHYACAIYIPAGLHPVVEEWDEAALLLSPAGQHSPEFRADGVISAGDTVKMGERYWQALAAPGHDNHALAFFNQDGGILISGDALWENGFGVVFSELLGDPEGLVKTRQTLDAFARLPLKWVLPGHGRAFYNVEEALTKAYARVQAFTEQPERIAWNGLRALLVFYLLEKRRLATAELAPLLRSLPLFNEICARHLNLDLEDVAARLAQDLIKGGAIREIEGYLVPC